MLKKYPKKGILHAVGHIDAAWFWTPEMTKWKILKTLARVLTLLKNNKKPVFVMSSALYYSWTKEYFPEIYEDVKRMNEKNRIIPVGGMWVESDVIITPSETLVREILYGQRFFEKELGNKCWIGWLPDSFGFSSNLPQIMKESGIKLFVTHKPYWNEYNKFPYQVFIWEGIDSTRIPSFNIIGDFAKTGDAWLTDYLLRLLEQLESWSKINNTSNIDRYDNSKYWEIQLLGAFHDVISGTITHDVHEYFSKEYKKVIEKLSKEISELLINLTGNFKGLIIYNPLQWDVTDVLEIDMDPQYVLDYQDQIILDNEKILLEATIPGNGYIVIPLKEKEEKNHTQSTEQVIENEELVETKHYRIKSIAGASSFPSWTAKLDTNT
ncbi:MAG: hypothetical protein J7L82_02130 [Staphylothermus sp.]|nr:hypothetical protein [Staphylothermus sp.]